MITSKLVLTALEIRKIAQQREIVIVYVLLDGKNFDMRFLLFQSFKLISKC